jgi:ubiquitin-activating enzyme E1
LLLKDKEGIVTVHEDKRHHFTDGDYVTFREVEGMTQVNGQKYKVRFISPFSFAIGDTSSFDEYRREGTVEHVKVPEPMAFRSFE